MKNFLLKCLFILTLLGCNREKETKEVPVTPSENLNALLNAVPISWIDLNNVEVDTISIPSDRIFEDRMFVSESLYVTSPKHITTFGDHLIVNEFGKGQIVALDKNGIPQQVVGRKGRGPGEFEHPYGLMSVGSKLYIYDFTLKRISVFDEEYELLKTFDFKDAAPSSFSNKIVMNKEYIAYENFYSSTFHDEGSNSNSDLLWVRLTENPDSVYFTAMPRIIPFGKQPNAYNNPIFSINAENELAAAFPVLPYLFVYQDSNHVSTVALEAVHFDTTDNPSLKPTEPVGNNGVGVKNVLLNLNILDNGDILFSSFGQLHHLERASDGGYTHHKSYYLKREDTGEKIINIQNMAAFREEPSRFFVIGWQNIFELNLDVN